MAIRTKKVDKLAQIGAEVKADSGASTPTNFLFKFFYKICLELGFNGPLSLDRALENFIRDPRNGMQQHRAGIASDKNNLLKQMFPPDRSHSWKVFVKSLRVLGFYEIEFTIKGKHYGSPHVTIHTSTLKLPDFNSQDEEQDELTSKIESLHKED